MRGPQQDDMRTFIDDLGDNLYELLDTLIEKDEVMIFADDSFDLELSDEAKLVIDSIYDIKKINKIYESSIQIKVCNSGSTQSCDVGFTADSNSEPADFSLYGCTIASSSSENENSDEHKKSDEIADECECCPCCCDCDSNLQEDSRTIQEIASSIDQKIGIAEKILDTILKRKKA